MTVKEMECVYEAIWHAKTIVEKLGCENFPYADFEDDDVGAMFYKLNRMCIKMTAKIEAQKKKGE